MNTKNKIFVIMGKSASGKNTVCEKVLSDESLNVKRVVTYTTRPKRFGEHDDVDYRFVTDEVMDNMIEAGKVIDLHLYKTAAGTWRYCTADDGQFDLNDHNSLIIATPEMVHSLRHYFKDCPESIVPIYINVDDGDRLARALKREREQATPKYEEMCRRFLADQKDFSDEVLKNLGKIKTVYNGNRNLCADSIKDFIRKGRTIW